MRARPAFEKYLQIRSLEAPHISREISPETGVRPLTITLSRQSGSGAHRVAESLAGYLQTRRPQPSLAWTVFDRNLVETVLEDHNLPPRLARYMPEDRFPVVADTLDDLLGMHPPAWTLVRRTVDTILRLGKRGNAILIGRAAHIITRPLDHVFHVRLVGSLQKRVDHLRELRGIGRQEALVQIQQEDRGRERYLKRCFGEGIDDPLAYHLVINTDRVPYERAARIIGDAAIDSVDA
jgi:hypothetical protein